MTSPGSARNSHRLLAYVFTVIVLVNVFSAVAGGPDWVGYLAVAPLILMMVTGWYLLWATTGTRRDTAQRSSV